MRSIIGLLAFYLMNWVVITVGTYCVARSVSNVPVDEMFTVGSAQALGYVAALATLVAPAGLGVRDAVFAWAVKGAVPGGKLCGRLPDRDRRARRPDGGRSRVRGRGDRARQAPGLEHPHRRLPPLSRGGGGGNGGRLRGEPGRPGPVPLMGRLRVRWSALGRWLGGGLALLLVVQLLPPLLRPPPPRPLAADIGLPPRVRRPRGRPSAGRTSRRLAWSRHRGEPRADRRRHPRRRRPPRRLPPHRKRQSSRLRRPLRRRPRRPPRRPRPRATDRSSSPPIERGLAIVPRRFGSGTRI